MRFCLWSYTGSHVQSAKCGSMEAQRTFQSSAPQDVRFGRSNTFYSAENVCTHTHTHKKAEMQAKSHKEDSSEAERK